MFADLGGYASVLPPVRYRDLPHLLSLLAVGGAITTAPDMQRYLVGEQGWMSDAQFTAGVAIAQAAPGPNILFVAVMGWHVAGVAETLKKAGFRVEADLRNEKISYKIREHSLQKLPFQLVIGDKEVAAQLVAVRSRKGEDLGQMPLDAFLSLLNGEIAKKGRAV